MTVPSLASNNSRESPLCGHTILPLSVAAICVCYEQSGWVGHAEWAGMAMGRYYICTCTGSRLPVCQLLRWARVLGCDSRHLWQIPASSSYLFCLWAISRCSTMAGEHVSINTTHMDCISGDVSPRSGVTGCRLARQFCAWGFLESQSILASRQIPNQWTLPLHSAGY